MQNLKFFSGVNLLIMCLSLVACGSLNKRSFLQQEASPKVVDVKAVRIALNHKAGYKEKHKYHVSSITRQFDKGQILREREELLDFTTNLQVEKVSGGKSQIRFEVTEKNGVIDLYDLVMPRIGEKLMLTLTSQAKVLKANDYPKTSAFYLSPVSLPEESVKVGDTWFLEERWINEKSSMPMKIELVSILKNVYEVNGRRFAEVETSGQVIVPQEIFTGLDFESSIVGRIVFALDSGAVAWSEVRNNEKLIYPDTTLEVLSCMEAKLLEPKDFQWPWAADPACNPKKDFVYAIPGN